MPQTEQICPPDCERRRMGCQGSCPEYLAFEQKKKERDREREFNRVKGDYGRALGLKLARYKRYHR